MIVLVGHPFAPIGMGEHIRCVHRALRACHVSAAIVDIYGTPHHTDESLRLEFEPFLGASGQERLVVFCINGDEVEGALSTLAASNLNFSSAHKIIYPAWELSKYPPEWASQLSKFDEIWAPSQFIAECLRAAVEKPVLHMPLACEVHARDLPRRSRRDFDLPESSFQFLFAFDFLSYIERKNPLGTVAAFDLLCQNEPGADVSLVIKTNNSDRRPQSFAQLAAAIPDRIRDRVFIRNGTLTDLDMKCLIGLSDCFVSLHRSEGFGRGLAEAMCLERVTICTGWSGNLDFCNENTSLLVDYSLVDVSPNSYPHWNGQKWAEPDIRHASKQMSRTLNHHTEMASLALAARVNVRNKLSFRAVGLRYDLRLSALLEKL